MEQKKQSKIRQFINDMRSRRKPDGPSITDTPEEWKHGPPDKIKAWMQALGARFEKRAAANPRTYVCPSCLDRGYLVRTLVGVGYGSACPSCKRGKAAAVGELKQIEKFRQRYQEDPNELI